jgi:hypothetical protein
VADTTEPFDVDTAAAVRALTDAVAARIAAAGIHEQACRNVLDLVRQARARADSSHDPQLLAVVRYLYWQHPTLSARDLCTAAGFVSAGSMTATIGSVPSGMSCLSCGLELRRTSRSWKPPRPDQLCPECSKQRNNERRRRWEAEEQRRLRVDIALVLCPAMDWQVAVTLVLAYPPITIGWDQKSAEREGLWLGYHIAQSVQQRLAAASWAADVAVESGEGQILIRVAEEVTGWDVERALRLTAPLTADPPTLVLTRLRRAVDQVRRELQP